MKLSKDKKLLLVTAIFFLVFAGVVYMIESAGSSLDLPDEFVSSFSVVAESSQKIVSLTNQTNEKISMVNEEDIEGDSKEALSIISEAKEINEEAKKEAINLSSHLADLTRLIPTVNSPEFQRGMLEVVIIESRMVQEFIDYSSQLNEFLDSLSVAVLTDSFEDRVSINRKLEVINSKSKAINTLNSSFVEKVRELGLINGE